MRKFLIAIAAICLLAPLSEANAQSHQKGKVAKPAKAAQATSTSSAQATMDYKQPTNWLKYENIPTKEVDLFYILPTVIMQGQDSVAYFSDKDKKSAMGVYQVQAGTMEPFTNVYAPFYRQVPLEIAVGATKNSEDYARMVRTKAGKQDVFAALDYYFKNVNNGRPYILASHSQGTAMMRAVLEEYMKNHPDYYKRMIACYALGFSLPKAWFAANPHIKPATDETGTGVVIGWNLEAPGATLPSMLVSGDDYVINPLSWSTNTAHVSASENHGTLFSTMPMAEKNGEARTVNLVTPGVADAQIDAKRGVLVCTTMNDQILPVEKFGGKSLHGMDWGGFYINIRENAIKRAEKFLGHSLNVNSMTEPGYADLPKPAPAPYKAKRVIDLEHHYNLESMLDEYCQKVYKTPYKNMPKAFHDMTGPLLDLGEGRIKAMDEAGVDYAHLSMATPPGVEWFEPETGKRYATEANNRLAAAIKAHPDRFGGFITIYPEDVEWSLKEIDRCAKMGLYGWMCQSNFNGKYVDDPKFWPIFAKLEALGMPIYLHPEFSKVPAIAEFGYCINGPSFGFMADALTCFMRMLCRGVFDKYPNLKIILGHDGEALPFLIDRINTAYRQKGDKLLSTVCEYKHEPSYYIMHNVWLTTSGNFSNEALRCCIDAMPAGRVMLSTDYSMEDFKASVSFIRDNKNLTAAEKDAILGQNAMNLGFGKVQK